MIDNVYLMDESTLDPFQLKKKKRIVSIREMLKKLEKMDLNLFVAKVAAGNGINPRTIRRDLDILVDAGEIEIKEGMITSL